jgi:CHAD domain-containing protein
MAAAVLARRHRKARRLGRDLRELDAAALHQFRIRIKKLRYAAEFLGDLWPRRRTRHYLTALKNLQQALGDWHDMSVAEARVTELQRHGAEDVAAWLAAGEKRQREAALACWHRFARRSPFWEDD